MAGIQCGVITSPGVIKDKNGDDDIIDNNGDNNNDNDNDRSHIAAQDYKPLLAVNICQRSSQGDKMEHKQVRHGTTFIIILCFVLYYKSWSLYLVFMIISVFSIVKHVSIQDLLCVF